MATYRRARRSRSAAGQAIRDTTFIASRLSWKGALILGVVLFSLFFWGFPALVEHQLAGIKNQSLRPVIEALFARRLHWFQWLGVALGLACAFFAIWNYLAANRLGREGQYRVGFFSRLLSKYLD